MRFARCCCALCTVVENAFLNETPCTKYMHTYDDLKALPKSASGAGWFCTVLHQRVSRARATVRRGGEELEAATTFALQKLSGKRGE